MRFKQPRAIFCLSEQFLATFRFGTHFKHDEVDDFIKTLIYADYLNVSQAYFIILERIIG